MRPILGTLLLLLPLVTGAEIYKHVGEDGVIRYSDEPPSKDAKPVELPPVQTFSTDDTGTYDSSSEGEEEETPASILMRESASYAGIQLVSPTAEQVFNQANPEVNASAVVEPGLAQGDRVVFLVDGLPVPAPEGQTSVSLANLDRGSHTVQAVVMDRNDAIQIQSETINFHLHQPSRLRPAPANSMPKLP